MIFLSRGDGSLTGGTGLVGEASTIGVLTIDGGMGARANVDRDGGDSNGA
jgi:hypothetical protein